MAEGSYPEDMKKGEKTKYRLARSMKECLESTSVDNITVKQITEKQQLMQEENSPLMSESQPNWKLSKKKIFSSWLNLLMQMPAHQETRKMQALKI